MNHDFFIHLSVNGHVGCFHVFVIVNSAAVNTGVHVSFKIVVFSEYMLLEKETATHSSIHAWKISWT